MEETSLIAIIIKMFHAIGLDTPAEASGWIVALALGIFSYWRTNVMDRKNDEMVDKLKDALEAEQREWRALVSKTDDMTFEVLKTSTNTITVLSEKINTLQMLLLQFNPLKKD